MIPEWRQGGNPCQRHNGQCVYAVGNPARCDYCHRSRAAIESCSCKDCVGGMAAHELRHVILDELARAAQEHRRLVRS